MIKFALCGHGTFGSSLYESLEMLLPEVEGVSTIDFGKKMDTTDLTQEILKVIDDNKDHPILFVCDIVGGAPFKTCAMESLKHSNVRVIAGTNLASLLEVYFQRNDDIDNVIQTMIKVSNNSIDYFPKE